MFLNELLAAEASELHEWLTEHGIKDREYSMSDGQLLDKEGRPYYLLPLIDRVILYGISCKQIEK